MSQFISSRAAGLFKAVSTGILCVSLLSCGGRDPASLQHAVQEPHAPAFKGELRLVAGDLGGPGNLDGVGADARFDAPGGIAFNAAGDLYVADTGSGLIRKVTPNGAVTTLAKLPLPVDLAIDAAGNTFVLSGPFGKYGETEMVITKVTADGKQERLAAFPLLRDQTDMSLDCTNSPCEFFPLAGIGIDLAGNVYTTQGRRVIKLSAAGQMSTLGILPKAAKSIVVDQSGSLYAHIGDANEIVRMDTAGKVVPLPVSLPATPLPGSPGILEAHTIVRLVLDQNGDLFVLDLIANGASRLLKVDPSGTTTHARDIPLQANVEGNALGKGLAMDKDSNLFFTWNNTLQKCDQHSVVSTFAGMAASYGHRDGVGPSAAFSAQDLPVAVDSNGTIWIAEPESYSLRKVSPNGQTLTIGNKVRGSSNGTSPTGGDASFFAPKSIAVGGSGKVYISDLKYRGEGPFPSSISANDVYAGKPVPLTTIRNVSAGGGLSTILESTGLTWGLEMHQLVWTNEALNLAPYVIASDKAGNIYIAETGWGSVRKYGVGGGESIVGSVSREWYGTGQAVFSTLTGMVVDANENIYLLYDSPEEVSYLRTETHRIEKVSPGKMPLIFAGGKTGYADGKGAEAKFNRPRGMTIDDAGNLYVADTGNHSIRKVTPDGTVTTLIGGGPKGKRTGMYPSLENPTGIAYSAPGTLVITTPGAVFTYQ